MSKLTPIRQIEDVMVATLRLDEVIRCVLIGPDLWLGFLLQIDLPQSSKELKNVTHVEGHSVIKHHMERVRKNANYFEEFPLYFRLNKYVDTVRVLVYPKKS